MQIFSEKNDICEMQKLNVGLNQEEKDQNAIVMLPL